jgi:hypothetical protein
VKGSGRVAAVVVGMAAASVWPAVSASAQGLPGAWQAGAGAGYETYQFLDASELGVDRVSLFTLPFAVRGRPLDRLHLQLSGAYAHGTLKRTDGSEATLSGATDTELRASYTFGRDLVVVSAAYLLPTGSSTHNLDEAEVAGTIAADLLPFRIGQWGGGGRLALSTAVAVPVNGFGVGFSLGYTVAQEYEALRLPDQEAWTYRPGDELRLRLGIDRTFGATGKAALVFSLQRYDEDALGGTGLLQPGNRYDVTGSYAFAAGPAATGVAYLGVAHRNAATFGAAAENEPFFAGMEIPAQDLVFAGGGLRLPVADRVFVPTVEGRLFRRSDGLNQGHLMGIGAALEWPVGSVVLLPSVRSRFGKVLLWEGAEAPFRGGEIALTIRMGAIRP